MRCFISSRVKIPKVEEVPVRCTTKLMGGPKDGLLPDSKVVFGNKLGVDAPSLALGGLIDVLNQVDSRFSYR